MDLYLFTVCLGFGGLVLMALMGLGHGGGHHGNHHHGPALPKFKGGHGLHHQQHQSHHGSHQGRQTALLGLLSPRMLFSLLFGFGATGMLLGPLVRLPLVVLLISLVAAAVFERGIIQPLWGFLLNFASKPAQTLDTLVLEEGHAATDFDGTGHGLVAVNLDGQTRQILGMLCREERAGGTRVRTGDRLFIRAVDGVRNTCTVSRLSC